MEYTAINLNGDLDKLHSEEAHLGRLNWLASLEEPIYIDEVAEARGRKMHILAAMGDVYANNDFLPREGIRNVIVHEITMRNSMNHEPANIAQALLDIPL